MALILLALIGPLVVEASAVALTAWLVDAPTDTTLTLAGTTGFALSIALAALWAHLTLRARAEK